MESLSFKEWVEYQDCLTESKQLVAEISILLEQGVEIEAPGRPEPSNLTEKPPEIEALEKEGKAKSAEIAQDLEKMPGQLKSMLGKISKLLMFLGKAGLGTLKLPWTVVKIVWGMLVYLAKLGIRMIRLAYLARKLHQACVMSPVSRKHQEEERAGAFVKHQKHCKHIHSLLYKEFMNVAKGMGWTVPFGVAWPILSEPFLHEFLGASALALVVTVWKGFGIMLHHIIDEKLVPFVEDESIPEDTRKKVGKAIVDTLPDFVKADAEAQMRSIFQTITHVPENPKEWTTQLYSAHLGVQQSHSQIEHYRHS